MRLSESSVRSPSLRDSIGPAKMSSDCLKLLFSDEASPVASAATTKHPSLEGLVRRLAESIPRRLRLGSKRRTG